MPYTHRDIDLTLEETHDLTSCCLLLVRWLTSFFTKFRCIFSGSIRVGILKCVPIDKYHVFVFWTDLLCSNSIILSEVIVKWIDYSFLSSNMYGYVYIWSVSGLRYIVTWPWVDTQKRHVHSNFSKLLLNMINTTVIKITVICDTFRRSKVIQHCKTLKMSMAYIFLM